jgi:membrane-anchored glycerophosphoryl diester phosphodiesterase (GDPDase)
MASTGAGAAIGAGAGLIGVFAFGIVLYILSALLLSLPRIAVDNKRLFQALDESVQSTKGNRLRIIVTLLPFAVLMAAAFAGIFAGGILGGAVYLVSALVSSIYFLSLLTEINSRLQ